MKDLDTLVKEVIKKVRDISPDLPITDSDIACLCGIVMHVMYEEDIANRMAAQAANSTGEAPQPTGASTPLCASGCGKTVERAGLSCGCTY